MEGWKERRKEGRKKGQDRCYTVYLEIVFLLFLLFPLFFTLCLLLYFLFNCHPPIFLPSSFLFAFYSASLPHLFHPNRPSPIFFTPFFPPSMISLLPFFLPFIPYPSFFFHHFFPLLFSFLPPSLHLLPTLFFSLFL